MKLCVPFRNILILVRYVNKLELIIYIVKYYLINIYTEWQAHLLSVYNILGLIGGTHANLSNHSTFVVLDAFSKFRKATISFAMSVCLSVRPSVRIGITRLPPEGHGIFYFAKFRKSVEKIQVSLKPEKNKGGLYMKTYVHLS